MSANYDDTDAGAGADVGYGDNNNNNNNTTIMPSRWRPSLVARR